MAIQTANLGTPPSGAGGDTFRSAATKFNENFSNNEHAACRLVGTQAGNVMEVGAFGLGVKTAPLSSGDLNTLNLPTGFYSGNSLVNAPVPNADNVWGYMIQQNLASVGAGFYEWQIFGDINGDMYLRAKIGGGVTPWSRVWTQRNTTSDSNGFIKAASPIVKLFLDKVELNNEAQQQEIIFEKLGVGDYLIKGSTGFAQEGWYVETPKDANGNSLVAVVYEQLENQDISVKTYKKKFDIETASIVADLEQAIDIPVGRWIDIRLQELPQPEFVPPVSITPASFQPTGISQAVSEMMNGTEQ